MAGQDYCLLPRQDYCLLPRDLKDSPTQVESKEWFVVPTGGKRIKRFKPSASAQELRCFQLEREKDDVTSPRGAIEACIIGINDGSRYQNKKTDSKKDSENSQKPSYWQKFAKLCKKESVKRLPSFTPLSFRKLSRRKSSSVRENIDSNYNPLKSSWKNFTLHDLEKATDNFSQENVIGQGGYAEVYKGTLADGQLVAIKRLSEGTREEQVISFLSEIGIIAHLNHPNTAKMVGYGVEGGTFLVLELSSLGSLASLLHGSKKKLNWEVRYKIILGIADGLLYLHENCERRIIHRDIKADNILLTEGFEPQICDFGLAKWLPKQWSHHNVPKSEGTFGYFAPEYFMHGIVDEKTDVFSFGVLLLELITGRPALDDSGKSLVIWAKPLIDRKGLKELVDPSLHDEYDSVEMERIVLTASMCVEPNPVLRPRMSQVLIILQGNASYPNCSRERQKRYLQRTYSEELLDAEEYNSTKYLSDLTRLKQLVLGA
ncbi:hypothetical protein LIER_07754 [Lithospermum erythrorhizon]|uniref:non-specific serine/threonine protein kinase n=1 Tax=Lithospermum erythrorhizon TaxID=34254 RepID=A0AAV3P9C7_LITER